MYPRVKIRLNYYRENLSFIMPILKEKNMGIMAVTKVYAADQKFIDVLNEFDIDYLADSRIKNLKKMKTHHQKAILRLPQKSEIKDVIKYADLSLNSELKTIELLNNYAQKMNKSHDIILMFDIGDLREGIHYKSEYITVVKKILNLSHINLKGIGTNVTCYGGVIPYFDTMEKLIKIKALIEQTFNMKLEIISGGNSSMYEMVKKDEYSKEINQLRLGELLILGKETSFGRLIEGMHDDVITIDAQIIELGYKPTLPEGTLGLNAFGEKVNFSDRGNIYRGIVALGKQDVHPEHLIPPKGIKILGASSDHLIIEINNYKKLKLGDAITFKLTYGGILSVMQSNYVRRVYVK
jgi:ornithine racemase